MNNFPSPELIDWCVEHREFVNGLWKPRVGDWFAYQPVNRRGQKMDWQFEVLYGGDFPGWTRLPDHIWLPRQDQLMEMLEEGCRGYTICCRGPYTKTWQAILAKEDEESIVEYGPDPAGALLKCLLAVMEKEGR